MGTHDGRDFDHWRRDRIQEFEAFLDRAVPNSAPFASPMRYPLLSGGKRIRPLLCLASCDAIRIGRDVDLALPMAAAVELIHTYSLVHDDLPCMDDDDERRGRPTVHKAYTQATAVLVGDALLTHAFRILASHLPSAMAGEAIVKLADASGHLGMIGGQVLDMGLDGPVDSVDRVTELHALKTGRLIRCACELGAMAAGDDGDLLRRLTRYGELVGMAFQLVDDILDADEDEGDRGPPSFVKLLGVEETARRAEDAVAEAKELVRDMPRPGPLLALAEFTVARKV